MEPVDHWKTAIAAFSDVLGVVADDQWSAPTPCPDWTVLDLVRHVADFQRATVGQLDAPASNGVEFDDDPVTAWSTIRTALETAVAADGALDEMLHSPFVTAPFREALMLPTVDLMFHAWDLARAIGVDESLPEVTCAACLEALVPFDELIRQSGGYPDGYADKVEPPRNADTQTRFLCFGGRQP